MTIRVFVGTSANHEDAESQAVLEWSIRKHASDDVEITWMKLSRDPESPFYCDPDTGKGWATGQWATPFTAFRWAVPELCGFEGRAIYMDSDVIVMDDLAKLWNQEFYPPKVVIARGGVRFCVSLWRCDRAERLMMPIKELRSKPNAHKTMTQVFRQNADLVQDFQGNWNCLDGEEYDDLHDPDIKAIHYTSMRHQPHLRHAVPRLAKEERVHWFDGEPANHWRKDLIALFDELLEEAEANGFPVSKYTTEPVFGPYKKQSVAGQGRRIPHWGGKFAA